MAGIFYHQSTNPKFNNANYEQLVAALYNVQEMWGIEIIDFYFYRDMDAVGDSALSSMMSDSIHPNDDGYEWMAEVIGARLRRLYEEKALAAYFACARSAMGACRRARLDISSIFI